MRINSGFHQIVVTSLLAVLTLPAVGKIIYVDDDAPPPGDGGASWTTAYRFLQDALTDANDSPGLVEIRVAQGTYKPDEGANQTPGDVRATFNVVGGFSLRGGFAGLGHSDPNAQGINAYETILSGDLEGDDPPITRPADIMANANYIDNSYGVMKVQDANGTALIERITVESGYDDILWYALGGGAAVYCPEGSRPTISNCTFRANTATSNFGGAIFGGAPDLINCTFEHNFAGYGGAVSYCTGSIRNCRFIDNAAWWGGGAIAYSSAIVSNCSFLGNSADEGGAVFLGHEGNLTLANCTFAQNIASTGRALSSRPSGQDDPVIVYLTNCVLWNGGDEIRSLIGSTVEIRYSDVQGGQVGIHDPCETITWDQGNIDVDPCFAYPGHWDANGTADDPNDDVFVEGDYHLKSQAGRWDPNSGSWVQDDVTSPCIDAGDPNSNFSNEVWPHGERINMGAYGGTAQASMSAEPTDLFLPRIACIYWENSRLAEDIQSFLQAHGCSVTLIRLGHLVEHPLDGYDLIMIATDTPSPVVWNDEQAVAALNEAGKPILGVGDGGYRFFGKLGLTIGYPNGASGTDDSVAILDPDSTLYARPYPVAVGDDAVLQLYETASDHVMIYIWPAPREDVTILAGKVNGSGYYPLVAEAERYFLWGFTESPEQMTEAGKHLFLNAVILTANEVVQSETAPAP